MPLLAVLYEVQEGPRLGLAPGAAAEEAPGMLGEGSGAERGTRPGGKGEKHRELMPSPCSAPRLLTCVASLRPGSQPHPRCGPGLENTF